IIINSFNRLSLLKNALAALSSWLPKSEFNDKYGIVIFDAGSTDGTIEWMKSIENQENLIIKLIVPSQGQDTSFSAGLNAGVKYAEKILPDLKYLLFYETDNQILSGEPLINALNILEKYKELSACGFTVRYLNGQPAGAGMTFPKL